MPDGVVELGVLYRVGPGGITVTRDDGMSSYHAEGKLLRFHRQPLEVQGELYPIRGAARTRYERQATSHSPEDKEG